MRDVAGGRAAGRAAGPAAGRAGGRAGVPKGGRQGERAGGDVSWPVVPITKGHPAIYIYIYIYTWPCASQECRTDLTGP